MVESDPNTAGSYAVQSHSALCFQKGFNLLGILQSVSIVLIVPKRVAVRLGNTT